MPELTSVVESESVEKDLASGRVCDHCAHHVREAKLIQSSLLPTKKLCHESVEIAFRFLPFSDVGGDFADFFRLPNDLSASISGTWSGRLLGGHVQHLGDGNSARNSQDRDG
jgi:serine phosphatase RsbU (regulator of sigma subunit)